MMQYYRSVSDHYPVYVEVNIGNSDGTAPSSKYHNNNNIIYVIHLSSLILSVTM